MELERIDEQLDRLERKVDEITKLLAGDKFGRSGIVANQRLNHDRITKLENVYNKIIWFGGLGTFLLAMLIAFKEEIKAFFTHGHH